MSTAIKSTSQLQDEYIVLLRHHNEHPTKVSKTILLDAAKVLGITDVEVESDLQLASQISRGKYKYGTRINRRNE